MHYNNHNNKPTKKVCPTEINQVSWCSEHLLEVKLSKWECM